MKREEAAAIVRFCFLGLAHDQTTSSLVGENGETKEPKMEGIIIFYWRIKDNATGEPHNARGHVIGKHMHTYIVHNFDSVIPLTPLAEPIFDTDDR